MGPTTFTLGLTGLGVVLLWSALANQNPVDVLRSAFDRKHTVRPLSTGAGRERVEAPTYTGGPTPSGLGTTGATIVELFYKNRGWDDGKPVTGVGHEGHVHAAVSPGVGWQVIVAYLNGMGIRPKIGSTTGGVHAPNSKHYDGDAVDFPGQPGAGPDPELDRVYAALEPIASGKATL